jgi:hypothetical protein
MTALQSIDYIIKEIVNENKLGRSSQVIVPGM